MLPVVGREYIDLAKRSRRQTATNCTNKGLLGATLLKVDPQCSSNSEITDQSGYAAAKK